MRLDMKRIALDLRPLQVGHENRGIGNYLVNILEYFPTDSVEYIFIRYSKSDPVNELNLAIKDAKYQEIILTERKFGKSYSEVVNFVVGLFDPVFFKVMMKFPSIYIQPDYLFGFPRAFWVKKVVVSYDLIPLLFKNMYTPSWRRFYRQKQYRFRSRVKKSIRAYYYTRRYKKGLKTLRHASKIISISKTTTNDIVKLAGVNPKRIKTIYLAPSFSKVITQPDRLRSMSEIEKISKKYLLFIGGTDARREAHEIVFAHNLLNSKGVDFHLVFAGNEFVPDSTELNILTKKAIETSSYKDKIHMLGRIDEEEKRIVLENAFAFVYPTLYEGFGLPLLEAMQCKTPVVTYPNPATKEIAGKAAMYTDVNDGNGIYKSITTLLDNEKLVEKLVSNGTKRVKQFSWDDAGHQTADYIFKK